MIQVSWGFKTILLERFSVINNLSRLSKLPAHHNHARWFSEIQKWFTLQANWWKKVSGVQTIKTNPNALIVWLCGEYAIEANQCTDSIFESTILTLIKHYTGICAPKPDQIIR